MRSCVRALTVIAAAALAGCSSQHGTPQVVAGASTDAARAAGPGFDAGRRDAGAAQTSTRDAAVRRDASLARDASSLATGARDASARDAGRADAARPDAGRPDAGTDAGADRDRFGVRKLYPTIAAGREWFLPDDAEKRSSEWNVESNTVTRASAGTFHTVGNNGEVRLSVASPSGSAWWRNVEMTGYFRYTAPMDSNGQERHWEFLARGERHSSGTVNGNDINDGVSAPAGTAAWPGYPYGDVSLNEHCLGTSYHGNFYLTGHGLFEKEVSHSNGYASQRAETSAANFADPMGRWFGLKYVLQNADAGARVHFELWLDANGDGDWQRLTQGDDTAGSWAARDINLDGCTLAPLSYTPAQLMTWAGPWVIFRSDSIAMDFRWLSAREIAALP